MATLDYLDARENDGKCPECEKHKKHVKMVENEGKALECPSCHYMYMVKS